MWTVRLKMVHYSYEVASPCYEIRAKHELRKAQFMTDCGPAYYDEFLRVNSSSCF